MLSAAIKDKTVRHKLVKDEVATEVATDAR